MRSKLICLKCRSEIPLADVNVSTDIALCRQCGQTWSYADLLADRESADINTMEPPRGAWFNDLSPGTFEVGVSTRSAAALFLVPFMCVWSGFSLGGIYGSQFIKGQFDPKLSLFGIPSVLGTLLFGSIALMTVCGKVVVKVDGENGTVFTGVGPIGWRRRFNWRGVSAVRCTESHGRRGSVSKHVRFEGEKSLAFATGVKDERLNFMLAVLRRKWQESRH